MPYIYNVKKQNHHWKNILQQVIFATACVVLVCGLSYFFKDWIGYKVVALLLLMTCSLLALVLDFIPVIIATTLSAFGWNFFFIPPVFTFHIGNAEDFMLFLMYFFVALLHAVLHFKIRKEQRKVREKENKEKQLAFHQHILNSLSHELRTPIATIIGSVDVLQDSTTNIQQEDRNSLLHEIQIAGLRLDRQVENLLNSSRLQANQLQVSLDWCDPNELLLQTIDLLPPHEQNILFHPEDLAPLVKTDRFLVEQIVINLLHNAIVHTASTCEISLSSIVQNESWKLSISDNGTGIPAKQLETIFETFQRLPSSKPGGTGLGLSIVKGFTEILNGAVVATNAKNGGLEISVTLPITTTYMNQLKHE